MFIWLVLFSQSDLQLSQDKSEQLKVKALAQGLNHGSLAVLGIKLMVF